MALLSRRKATPVIHDPTERSAFVAADPNDVLAHLKTYSDMQSPKHANECVVQLWSAPGWTEIRFPERLHPWSFHNVSFWMLDIADDSGAVVAVSAANSNHPGYRLVRDEDLSDSFAGWDDHGVPWTVHVPMNHIVKGDPVRVLAPTKIPSCMAAVCVISVLIEDPGPEMNPRNEATMKDRNRLRRMHSGTDVF
ncbi:MAG: hypothetical protein ACI8Y4_003371 [Candidatus Poriferisodalaceae bacterium]|jgi:hypothetical protein